MFTWSLSFTGEGELFTVPFLEHTHTRIIISFLGCLEVGYFWLVEEGETVETDLVKNKG